MDIIIGLPVDTVYRSTMETESQKYLFINWNWIMQLRYKFINCTSNALFIFHRITWTVVFVLSTLTMNSSSASAKYQHSTMQLP